MSDGDKDRADITQELRKLISTILDGMLLKYSEQQKAVNDPKLQNYFKEIIVNETEAAIDTDRYYVHRLFEMQTYVEDHLEISNNLVLNDTEKSK